MINNLPSPKTNTKQPQRGRGYGSRRGGHTTGRGTKGQKSRTGYKKPTPDFEGGQNPLSKRTPKLSGFKRGYFQSREKNVPIKLSEIAAVAKASDVVNEAFLIENGLLTNTSHKTVLTKILFDKDISKKIKVEGIAISAKAKKAIEKVGGSVA